MFASNIIRSLIVSAFLGAGAAIDLDVNSSGASLWTLRFHYRANDCARLHQISRKDVC